MTWSLESELLTIAGQESVGASLAGLGLARTEQAHLVASSREGWVRSGAETYLYMFGVKDGDSFNTFALKACVALGGLAGVRSILSEWCRRRHHLDEMGVSTPTLFGVGQGVIIEEYIPHSFKSILNSTDESGVGDLLGTLSQLVSQLLDSGYLPVSLHDLRSRGDDAVVIDFGEDLGGQRSTLNPERRSHHIDMLMRSAVPPRLHQAIQSIPL